MIITKEVPPSQWRRTLDDLSRLHGGSAVQLMVLDDDGGPQVHGAGFTLGGLTADGDGGAGSIAAILSGPASVTHIVDRPRTLHLEMSWESRTANLQITDASGTRTLISLGPPVLPERVRAPGRRTAGAAASRALCRIRPGG